MFQGILSLRQKIIPAFYFQVEMLYQRYFLKMNLSNMTNLISLLLLLCTILLLLAATDIIVMQSPSSSWKSQNASSRIGFDPLDKSIVTIVASGAIIGLYGGELK